MLALKPLRNKAFLPAQCLHMVDEGEGFPPSAEFLLYAKEHAKEER